MPELRATIVQTIEQLTELVEAACLLKRVGYDVEGSGLRPERGARICGFGIGLSPSEGFYVPVRHEKAPDVAVGDYDAYVNLPIEEVAAALRPLMESETVAKVGAYLSFDTKMTKVDGLPIVRPRDVQALVRIVLPKLPRPEGERGAYGLKSLKQSVLKEGTGERDVLRDWLTDHGLDEYAIHMAPIGLAGQYCVDDSTSVLRLLDKVLPLAKADAARQKKRGVDPRRRGAGFLWRLENELLEVIADIESTGFPVDTSYFEKLYNDLGGEVDETQARINERAGRELNPRSNKQVSELLYDELGLPCRMRTEKGGRATSADALKMARLDKDVPIIDDILDCRLLGKLRTTYCRGKKGKSILENTVGGRVYGELRPDGARSGRLSAASPNLTNIPKRKSERIRHGFWSGDSDYVLVSFDQSQVEPRLLAHYSKAPSLLRAFRTGRDVYKQMGVDAGFATKPEEVDKSKRRLMKTFVLGLNYRMGAKSLGFKMSLDTGSHYSEDAARSIMDTYFDRVPEVKAFHRRCDSTVERTGLIATLFGRLRYLDSDQSFIGTNHVIQGSAAELFKIAMVKAWRALKGRMSQIVAVIHDDILVRMHLSEMYLIPRIVDCLTQYDSIVKLRVPMEANVTIYDTDPDGRWIGGRELTMTEILDAEMVAMQDRIREERKKSGMIDVSERGIIEMEKRVGKLAPKLFKLATDLRLEVKDGWRRGESAEEFVTRLRKLERHECEMIKTASEA